MTRSNINLLIQRRDRALAQFATLGDLRPGTLLMNFTKCGKPGCRCAVDEAAKHGPHYMINRTLGSKKKSVRLRQDEIETARGELDEYKRFRAISAAFIQASEELAEARRLALREGDKIQKKR